MDNPIAFYGGHCSQLERISNRKGKFRNIDFPALFFLLKHKEHGYILFDTGYSRHFIEDTGKFPWKIYSILTPVSFKNSNSAIFQLNEMGIGEKDIKYIFISHFHADHISGLRDFPSSQFICSKEAYFSIQNKDGIRALKQAFIPSLMPDDFDVRVRFIEDCPIFNNKTSSKHINDFLDVFEHVYDIFGDNTLLSVNLSGHAKGQFGLLVNSDKPTFLIADATWDRNSFQKNLLPSKLAFLIMDSQKKYKENVDKIHQFYSLNPNLEIIPSHCSLTSIKEGLND